MSAMVLPSPEEIVEAIDAVSVARREDQKPRSYIGASAIGNPCDAYLGFSLRGYPDTAPDSPHVLRIFDLGHEIEEMLVKSMIEAKIPVLPKNPKTGKQWEYTMFGRHVIGHTDGLLDYPGFPMILEVKSMNASKFNSFITTGVRYSHRNYFDQIQLLMGLSGYKRTMLIVYCKDTSKLSVEYVDFDGFVFSALLAKVDRVLSGEARKISDDPKDWRCAGCFKREACLEGADPQEKSMRTCGHSRPKVDGSWECQKGCSMGCQDWTPWTPLPRNSSPTQGTSRLETGEGESL